MSAISQAELLLTEIDRARLLKLGAELLPAPVLELLAEARVVPSPAIPPRVATMYSQLQVLHEESQQSQKLTLCYPADAEPAEGFISVLSPVGAALLGCSIGARVAWTSPSGEARHLRLQEILFQPEASGDYAI